MKDDRVYLAHILDAIDHILDYTAQGKTEFLNDTKTQDAVVRNLEIIGEAAKQVSDDVKGMSEPIPWRRLAGMRDKLIHEYFGVNLEIVWEVVEKELPVLGKQMQAIIEQFGPRHKDQDS